MSDELVKLIMEYKSFKVEVGQWNGIPSISFNDGTFVVPLSHWEWLRNHANALVELWESDLEPEEDEAAPA